MTEPANVLYTARTDTTGGRDGASRSADGRLDIKLSRPGGPGNGTDPGTPTNPNYPGGFPSGVTGTRAYAAHAGVSAQASGAPQLDANGALTDAGDLANVNAEVADVGGDASVVVGRYTNGVARFRGGNVGLAPNGGIPWVVTAPLAAPLPTTGTIDYEVLAATRPVFATGRAAPGSFDANLTIGFGPSNLSYGFDGTIVMPETYGDVRYDFASAGRDTGAIAAGLWADLTAVSLDNPVLFGRSGDAPLDGATARTGNTPLDRGTGRPVSRDREPAVR